MIDPETQEQLQVSKTENSQTLGDPVQAILQGNLLPQDPSIEPNDILPPLFATHEVLPLSESGIEGTDPVTVYESAATLEHYPTRIHLESQQKEQHERKKENTPYKELGDILLGKLGERTLHYLANQLHVTPSAVHTWITGKCRPRAYRLGQIANILECSAEEIEKIAELAGYEYEKVHTSEGAVDYRIRSNRELRRLDLIADKVIELLRTDDEFRQLIAQKLPDVVELVSRIPR